jgi:hypothetical protein
MLAALVKVFVGNLESVETNVTTLPDQALTSPVTLLYSDIHRAKWLRTET